MIERIDSSLPGFKTLEFHAGFNVLVARKSPGASTRQTRNGVGKTSLVELIHFLLGGSVRRDHVLRTPVLWPESFTMDLRVARARLTVQRSPARSDEVLVSARKGGGIVIPHPLHAVLHGPVQMSNDDWKRILGREMFGLPDRPEDDDGAPTLRALVPYFARRQRDGGFHRPESCRAGQQAGDVQVAVTYLLGLDASIPRALQGVRERERSLRELRKAARGGTFGEVVGKASELRTKVTVLEARLIRLRDQLAGFRVVPQYREQEQEASHLTTELARITNENQLDRESLARLEETVATEVGPGFADVRKVYDEAGVVLPELVRKRFEEVERFHRSVVDNRRSHLQAEIDAIRQRLEGREAQRGELDARRAQLMTSLRSGGALEHFAQLQAELARLEAQAEAVR